MIKILGRLTNGIIEAPSRLEPALGAVPITTMDHVLSYPILKMIVPAETISHVIRDDLSNIKVDI